MTQDSHYKLVSKLKPGKIIIPILIGLAVVGWFIIKEIDTEVLSQLAFTWKSAFWLLIAWCCMIGRDLGYMIRIRILSEKDLNWRQAFRVIMLWEFTSAITPSTVGGTAVAVVFIHKEGHFCWKKHCNCPCNIISRRTLFCDNVPGYSFNCGKRYTFHNISSGNRNCVYLITSSSLQ